MDNTGIIRGRTADARHLATNPATLRIRKSWACGRALSAALELGGDIAAVGGEALELA